MSIQPVLASVHGTPCASAPRGGAPRGGAPQGGAPWAGAPQASDSETALSLLFSTGQDMLRTDHYF